MSQREPTFRTHMVTDLAGVTLSNPTVVASGIWGLSCELVRRAAEGGAGAATIKSVSLQPRKGHPGPTVIGYESGLLNAVGYSNSGVEAARREFDGADRMPIPVFASAIRQEPDEFARVVEGLMPCGFAAVELPLSCPHTPGYGVLAGHSTPEATEKITRAVSDVTDRPIFVKLSPNVPAIGELVLAALEGGASGISAVNTMGPGMIINVDAREPVLGFDVGGISGPALRPVAVRCVYDAWEAMERADRHAPIIGIGGVCSGRDALQMIMAGASAVGIGTAVYHRGDSVFKSVVCELDAECQRLGIQKLEDVVGAAHG